MGEGLSIEAFAPAARAAIAAFGLEAAELTPVSNSENVVFRVTEAGSGDLFALRLHRPGYHALETLEAERSWTSHLAQAGMIVPTGRRALDGQWYVPVRTPDPGQLRYAGVTVWHRGHTLESILGDDRGPLAWPWFRQLGGLIAQTHDRTANWVGPPGFSRHRLDADALVGEKPFWGRFWDCACFDAEEKRLLRAVRALVAERLAALERDGAPFGLIHADSHPGNVLVSEDRLGLIDFDDCAFGWHSHDFGVALYSSWSTPHFEAVKRHFLEGYGQAREVPADIDRQIALFLLIRSLTLASWRSDRPDIMRTAPQDRWKPDLMCEVRRALDQA